MDMTERNVCLFCNASLALTSEEWNQKSKWKPPLLCLPWTIVLLLCCCKGNRKREYQAVKGDQVWRRIDFLRKKFIFQLASQFKVVLFSISAAVSPLIQSERSQVEICAIPDWLPASSCEWFNKRAGGPSLIFFYFLVDIQTTATAQRFQFS